MADMEFTQICKEILGIGKKLEKIEPDELKKIKTDIERISEAVTADKTLFDTDKKDFDGKYNKIVEIIKTFDTLKAQIEEVLKNGTINDSTEALISTFSSKKIMGLLNEAKGAVDEKFSTIYKNGITPWSSSLEYPTGAISVLNDKLYQAKTQNINKRPSENKEEWRVLASEEWCEQTFLNKDEKIDSYSKTESDEKFVKKTELKDGTPIGAYLAWSSESKIPAGYLLCDGREISKSEYKELYEIIGDTYGTATDNTKFKLPKFNDGRFMRGTGGNAAVLGTAQEDAIRNIQGELRIGDGTGICTTSSASGAFTKGSTRYSFLPLTGGSESYSVLFSASKVVPTANENRPLNSAVVYIIKAKNVREAKQSDIDKTPYATETKAGIIRIKNSITGQQEDVAVSEKAVANIASIGINQTWQDMTGERQKNITYTNTTGRPILIKIMSKNTNVRFGSYFEVNGAVLYKYWEESVSDQMHECLIPAGQTYKYVTDGSIVQWFELR